MTSLYRRARYLMGALVEIAAYGDASCCSEGMEAAFSEMARVERLLSVYRPQSGLARLNAGSGDAPRAVDPELFEILSKAWIYAERSGGAFDPTAAPLIRLWGFGPDGERDAPPRHDEVAFLLQRVGFRLLRIDPASRRIHLLKEGVELNLGGVGKGYAIDRAVEKLKRAGVMRGMVNCGSTLYAWAPAGGPGWPVRIRHPRREGEVLETVSLCNRALSTSGDYEKFYMYGGRRFSHLIDPRTGYPKVGVASVSVTASTAMEADALSTAAFILGKEESASLFKGFPEAEGLLIEEGTDGALSRHPTPRWEKSPAFSLTRRRFLAGASLLLVSLFLPLGRAEAAVVYLTQEEGLRKIMPEAERFDVEEVALSAEQADRAQQLAGKGFREHHFQLWVGKKNNRPVGYALLLEVIGKERFITFLVGIDPEGAVKGVEVLTYRESRGSEVRFPRFTSQFAKKKIEDPLRLGVDIAPISGATLSSRAMAYAVRKALSIFEVIYKKGGTAG